MTAINAYFNEKFVCVIMDTLAGRGFHGGVRPHNYTSKIFALPHLNGILCGTGNYEVILEWHRQLQLNVLARDMCDVDVVAPNILKAIGKNYCLTEDYRNSSTIYHFGYLESCSHFGGFVYRSANGFQSERYSPEGLILKPEFNEYPNVVINKVPDDLIGPMLMQRQENDAAAPDKKIWIGGEIVCAFMNSPGRITLEKVHKFEDFEQMFETMQGYRS